MIASKQMLERYTKTKIKEVLAKYADHIYYFMPVPGGYGRTTIDYLGFAAGLGFAIEAKRPGGKPTEKQEVIIEDIERGGARVFVINSQDGLDALDNWLSTVTSHPC